MSIISLFIILSFFEIVDLFGSKFKVFMNIINLKYLIKDKIIYEKDIFENFLINKNYNIKYKDLNNLK